MEYTFNSKNFMIIFLLLASSMIYLGFAMEDPPAETTFGDYDVGDHNIYHDMVLDVRRLSTLSITTDSFGLIAFIHPEELAPSNISRLQDMTYSHHRFNATHPLEYQFENNRPFRLIVFSLGRAPETVSLDIVFDRSPFNATYQHGLITLFIGFVWLGMLINLRKDFKYVWRIFNAKVRGKKIRDTSKLETEDKFTSIFGEGKD